MATRMFLFIFAGQAWKLSSRDLHFAKQFISSSAKRYFSLQSSVAFEHSVLPKYLTKYGHRRCKSWILSAAVGLAVLVKKEQENETDSQSTKSGSQLDDDKQIIELLKHAKLFQIKQEFDRAEEYYHRALGVVNIIQQHKTWPAERVLQAKLYIYDGMANLALLRGNLVAAKKLFKEVMQGFLQQGKKQDDNAMIEVSLKLSVIYATQNRTEDADTGYRFCISMLEAKLDSQPAMSDNDTIALLGISADAYARFLIVRQDYSGALTNLQKALNIATTVLGDDQPQVAILLNDLATVYSLLHDYDAATSSLERAIAIGEKTNHTYLPILLCNQGALFYQRGMYKEARKHYERAAAVAKQYKDKEVLEKVEKALKSLEGQT